MSRMCEIIYVKSARGWKWRALDAEGRSGDKPSEATFDLFYDCVRDARARGYTENVKCLAEAPTRSRRT
jgi:hypothetical protein